MYYLNFVKRVQYYLSTFDATLLGLKLWFSLILWDNGKQQLLTARMRKNRITLHIVILYFIATSLYLDITLHLVENTIWPMDWWTYHLAYCVASSHSLVRVMDNWPSQEPASIDDTLLLHPSYKQLSSFTGFLPTVQKLY